MSASGHEPIGAFAEADAPYPREQTHNAKLA